MDKKQKLITFFLIILLASFLRIYKLSSLPTGLNSDEAAIAYDAYSLLKTGKDQWGDILPLTYFKSFGDYKLTFHFYLTIPSVIIFGLNEFAARFPSAFLGILTVILTYYLSKEIFKGNPKKELISLLSAFLLAVNPWHIVFSRTGHEITTSVFLVIFGIFLFLKKNPWFFLVFFLGFYTYHTSRVFLLLLLPVLLFLYKDNLIISKRKVTKIFLILYLLLFFLPFVNGFFSEAGRARIIQTTGVSKIGMLNQVNERRGLCQRFISQNLCRVFYNREEFFISDYLKNYFNYFSPFALFTHGIYGTDTFSLPRRGLLYLFEFPFVIVGAVNFFLSKNHHKKLIVAWLLLYPVPGSLVSFDNSRRMTLIIPLLQIFGSLGIFSVWQFLKQKFNFSYLKLIYPLIFCGLFCFSLSRFILDALEHNIVWSKDFKNGVREMISFVKENEDKYDGIFIADYYDPIYIYYLFFTQYSPKKFQDKNNIERQTLKEEFIGSWSRVYRIGKVHFFDTFDWKNVPEKSLFIIEPGRESDLITPKMNTTRKIIKTIKNLNNEPVFTIVEVKR